MAALTEKVRQRIRDYLPRYPSKQAVTLPALHLVHDEMRCVSREAIKEIADILNDLRTDAQNRVLALRAQPQVARVHQEIGAMLLG